MPRLATHRLDNPTYSQPFLMFHIYIYIYFFFVVFFVCGFCFSVAIIYESKQINGLCIEFLILDLLKLIMNVLIAA